MTNWASQNLQRAARAVGARAGRLGTPVLLILLGCAAGARAATAYGPAWTTPSWRMQLRTSSYNFQTVEPIGAELDHWEGYQEFDGAGSNLLRGHLAVRASGRVAGDLSLAHDQLDDARLYTGIVEGRWMGQRLTARLGRQFVQEGPTGLTLDGAWVSFAPLRRVTLRAFGGARAPLDRAFDVGSVDNDAAAGLRVQCTPWSKLQVTGSYAYRETDGAISDRPLGLEAGVTLLRGLRGTGRVAYDLERATWTREEIQGQWQPRSNWPMFSAQFVDRIPSVGASSYFSRFVADGAQRIRVGRTTARYEHANHFGGELEYMGSYTADLMSTRLGGAFLFPYGRIGYSARVGDAGEESAWYGDLRWRALHWLTLEGGATLATYALLKDAPDSDQRDLTTIYGRARAHLRDGLRLTAEVQSLDNPDYEEDVRVLVGLDLDMARGSSRFGLGEGGWLR